MARHGFANTQDTCVRGACNNRMMVQVAEMRNFLPHQTWHYAFHGLAVIPTAPDMALRVPRPRCDSYRTKGYSVAKARNRNSVTERVWLKRQSPFKIERTFCSSLCLLHCTDTKAGLMLSTSTRSNMQPRRGGVLYACIGTGDVGT